MKKMFWIAAAAVIVVAGARVAVVDPWQWRAQDPTGVSATVPVDDVGSRGPGDAAAAALQALPLDVVAGAASTVREFVAKNPDTAVPSGASIEAEPSTWVATGPDSGTIAMVMSVPGETSPREYIAVMVEEEGSWKLESTVEAEPVR